MTYSSQKECIKEIQKLQREYFNATEKHGGLCFRNLVIMNKICLSKLGSKLMIGENIIWF